MISAKNVSLSYGNKVLFENVNIKFVPGNCYGLIGANGAGKSTFLKILSGEMDDYSGEVEIASGNRISTLKQDHGVFDHEEALQTVIMGDVKLASLNKQLDEVYSKEDFSDEDGILAGEIQEQIEEAGGYEAEANAAQLLAGLGVDEAFHKKRMSDLPSGDKVKVLLAQALFGEPDILLLDEPTNNLDIHAISWLEDFLMNFEKTVIVVSHDRHFLNAVCTHMADIDYSKITIFVGNYDFWYQSSQMIRNMQRDQKRRAEEKAKDLKDFIARFSANASKSKQATARKKALDKLNLDDIKASTRKFPYIEFKPDRDIGNDVFHADSLTASNEALLKNISFELIKEDKIAFVGDELGISALFDILAERQEAAGGTFKWGATISVAYFPVDHSHDFEDPEVSLIDWLRPHAKEKDETYIRGFLGRMLFSGDEASKKVGVLSGGERVRMVLSRMMMTGANVLILDGPTAHLDLESIQALNNALIKFPGVVLFSSHDHQFVETIANKIYEISDGGLKLHNESLEEYLTKVNKL